MDVLKILHKSNNSKSIVFALRALWQHISPRRRLQTLGVSVMTLIATLAEVVSIGAVLPFLSALSSPEVVYEHRLAQPLIEGLTIESPEDILLPLTIFFALAAVFSGLARVTLTWAQAQLSFAVGADLREMVFRNALNRPFASHVSSNSSEVLSGAGKAGNLGANVILPILTIAASVVVLFSVLMLLIVVNPLISISSFIGFGGLYFIIMAMAKRRLVEDGKEVSRGQNALVKTLQEGLGGIRDVIIDGTQGYFFGIYSKINKKVRFSSANIKFLGASPRYVIESLAMVLIGILAYVMVQNSDGIAGAVPVLGALALGAQRLLPLMQQAYASYTTLRGGHAMLSDTLELLNDNATYPKDQDSAEAIAFDNSISFRDVSFSYKNESPMVLQAVSITIKKGDRVGFMGVTGSGKSTLMDIAMGLLVPSNGIVEVDGRPIDMLNRRAWQKHIAHVPQSIFLTDSTIAENIAFGLSKDRIDMERVRESARKAQISETIESWELGYDTVVGERGVKLSGGQRQRIGLARALYKDADLLIFDEATSALDTETERNVMSAINALDSQITMLVVAHRLSTLSNCSLIVEMNGGRVTRIGSFNEIVGSVGD